jgi:hypothetical protein
VDLFASRGRGLVEDFQTVFHNSFGAPKWKLREAIDLIGDDTSEQVNVARRELKLTIDELQKSGMVREILRAVMDKLLLPNENFCFLSRC